MMFMMRLSKADQAGFRMFKNIMLGTLLGGIGAYAYNVGYWTPRKNQIDTYYARMEAKEAARRAAEEAE
eukprot:CAMPEP_0185017730 /NCGR_PEP_ID=MMETSP1103-20130426/647_1 /TAXON_ID=36769 /ORGANISM="Paraphysomonas bandaiensis, Strain Caron Lab Isolate" /LENGTH=68 /DNA_ID=CAMNT_0027547291 /DNA_START=86 /DNA_END=292 /DNA_ORIENTATION=-